ncbi:hypothetical protein DXG03_004630 [Asterophora parasitica]|uniref:Uncharacterized protein n=1 Tax=Asterophora parasitica TaxID=117018 RepID=A0A9P7G9L3_9AGAR|nr:hypothetical protein DXG03_004630 [Asterophora parasitica]
MDLLRPVTHASLSNWEYMEIIRRAADPKCSSNLENSVSTIDKILDHPRLAGHLKGLFGVKGLQHDEDFASLIESPLGSWQAKVWDPAVGSETFNDFCASLSKPFGRINAAAPEWPFNHTSRMVTIAPGLKVDFAIVNYANWIKKHVVSRCPSDKTVEQTAPPNQTAPRIISRRLTLEYESKICQQALIIFRIGIKAFPPGKHFVVPSMPNITAVNALGDFDLAADRLAFIDGEGQFAYQSISKSFGSRAFAVDPWRPNTPHSAEYANDREDTILRPFKIIPGAVHHWDEYGLPNLLDEPADIRKIHGEMIEFVTEWLKDWKAPEKD